MHDFDFEYDGTYLSDYGFVIGSFDGSSESDLNGSQISFNQTSVKMGRKFLLANTKYEEVLTCEFDICKKNCEGTREGFYITGEEEREIRRWLNRKQYCKLQFLSERYEDIYFMGSFNVSAKELGGQIVSLHLTFTADSPFGYTDVNFKAHITENDNSFVIQDMSDETGDDIINMEITCQKNENLIITNDFNKRVTKISNCSVGEIVTMKNMIISSSIENRNEKIMNNFNFIFPMISNSFTNRKNTFTFSMPCDVTFSYKQTRKIGI